MADCMYFFSFQIPDEKSIVELAEKLKAAGIDHKLWIEQPENIPTCIVSKPYPKSEVKSHFQGLKLYKGTWIIEWLNKEAWMNILSCLFCG